MIREGHKLPADVMDRIPELLAQISKDADVVALYTFGSLATGDLKPLSDLDFGILVTKKLSKQKRPETYADIFVQLKNLGVIDNLFCDRLVKMAKFRNRLVHLYWEIDPQKVYEIIVDNLEDFKHFERDVVKFLKTSERKEKSSKDTV
jgi:predicted nucleotidyltransferase